jgi:hypothetical protein
MKAVLSFETSGSNYPTTRRNNLEKLIPQCENMFATNKNLSALCHFHWVMRQVSHMTSAVSFAEVFYNACSTGD